MHNYKLSILIPHLRSYDVYYSRLRAVLDPQLTEECQIIVMVDEGQMSIGKKRNWLLNKASGEYVCFIDSDDMVSEDYVKLVFEGINKGVDSCSLKGIITDDGQNPRLFIHSLKYKEWFEKDGIYYRNNNHLNTVRASIAKKMSFPETNHGEDHSYSKQLLKSGLIKIEHWIEPVIYHYLYRSKK